MVETISEIASRKIGGLLLLENNAFMIAPRGPSSYRHVLGQRELFWTGGNSGTGSWWKEVGILVTLAMRVKKFLSFLNSEFY